MQLTFVLIATLFMIGLVQALPTHKRDAGSLWGITYTARSSDGTCHSAEQVSQFIKRFKDNGIKNIRTYSQECDQLPNILNAIKKNGGGMKVLTAIWLDGKNDDEEISQLEQHLSDASNKDLISGIAVGNEAVQSGLMNGASVAAKVKQIKNKFGSQYKIGTCDTPSGFSSDMVDASDVIWVNIHPFFGGVSADQAVKNLQQQLASFQSKANGKDIIVSEVGWPTQGEANGQAQPSVDGLSKVVKALMNSNIQYYFFESHDSKWKGSGSFDVEPHWGIIDQNGKSKIPEFH